MTMMTSRSSLLNFHLLYIRLTFSETGITCAEPRLQASAAEMKKLCREQVLLLHQSTFMGERRGESYSPVGVLWSDEAAVVLFVHQMMFWGHQTLHITTNTPSSEWGCCSAGRARPQSWTWSVETSDFPECSLFSACDSLLFNATSTFPESPPLM